MKTTAEVVARIVEIESLYDPDDEYTYLDEWQQASLEILYWVLDRDLTTEERDEIDRARTEL